MIFQEQDQKEERSSSEKIQWWFMLYCKGRTSDFFERKSGVWRRLSALRSTSGELYHCSKLILEGVITWCLICSQSLSWGCRVKDGIISSCFHRLASRETSEPRIYCFCFKAQSMGSSHWTFHMWPAICTLASQPTQSQQCWLRPFVKWYRRY